MKGRNVMRSDASAILVALGLFAAGTPVLADAAPSETLRRIREGGRISLGYRTDAAPFSYRDEAGKPAGYAVELCLMVADAIQGEPELAGASVAWVPVGVENRFLAVQRGEVDLLCGAETVTLSRRKEVAFSIPTFPGGIGALIRLDAPARLKDTLVGRRLPPGPAWRASTGQLLQAQTFAVVSGTTAETWLHERLSKFLVAARIAPVDSYETGIRNVAERRANVLFGDRAILLDAEARHVSAKNLVVLDHLFTHEPVALALARGDEDFRLLVDRALSRAHASEELAGLYAKWFGEPDPDTRAYFQWIGLPE